MTLTRIATFGSFDRNGFDMSESTTFGKKGKRKSCKGGTNNCLRGLQIMNTPNMSGYPLKPGTEYPWTEMSPFVVASFAGYPMPSGRNIPDPGVTGS